MSDYFIGEIRMFAFAWAPTNWVICDGATMQVQQNKALFSLIGNAYGGNGSTTFMLPDLRGRVPLCYGVKGAYRYPAGGSGGAEAVALDANTMATHDHVIQAANATSTKPGPSGNYFGTIANAVAADTAIHYIYAPPGGPTIPLNPGTIGVTGDGQAHENRQPSAVVNFCISTIGIYPPRS